ETVPPPRYAELGARQWFARWLVWHPRSWLATALLILSAAIGVVLMLPISYWIDPPNWHDRPILTNGRLMVFVVPWAFATFATGWGLTLVALGPPMQLSPSFRTVRMTLWWSIIMASVVLSAGAWLRSAYLGISVWQRAPFEQHPLTYAD